MGPVSTIRPRYITATRSAMFQARPRSWVTTRMARPGLVHQMTHQGQDLAADRSVETGHWLVGQQETWLHDHGAGDHHTLTLTARYLMGIEREEPFRRSQSGAGQGLSNTLLLAHPDRV